MLQNVFKSHQMQNFFIYNAPNSISDDVNTAIPHTDSCIWDRKKGWKPGIGRKDETEGKGKLGIVKGRER